MAFSDKLSFVTVMDIAVVDSAILNGGSFEYAFDDVVHTLPFQATVDATKLTATIDSSSAGVTVTTGADTITISEGTTDIVFTLSTGVIALTAGDSDPTVSFTLIVEAQTVAEVVLPAGILSYVKPEGTLDTLTISNITQEGPRKEARGGKNAQPIIRYGKTMRLEVEDVVFNIALAPKFFGATLGYTSTDITEVSVSEIFPKSISLIGDTYIVDKVTGDRSNVYVTFPKFLPDGIFDITMESEGDIGMVSIAGELFSEAATQGDFFVISDKT